MPKTSDAMLKAINKYQTEKVEEFKIRVPKGEKAIIKAHAESKGKSLNGYVVDLIHDDMSSDVLSFVRINDNTSAIVKSGAKIKETSFKEIEKIVDEEN